MQAIGPQYLLFTDSVAPTCHERQWRFVLQPIGAGERIVAFDAEPDADSMRLNLLAVVRGLEALDGPSRVTLLAANRFVRRGIRRDLAQWRELDWRWERFGKLVPIRDLDLWQRVDRALAIHEVECSADGKWNMECGLRIAECGLTAPSNLPAESRNPQLSRLTYWGHELLNQLSGWGQPALSRTA
jgi:ribonuclease HI